MSITTEQYAANFLPQHRMDINNNNFNKVYEDWEKSPSYLTNILISAEINPLPYLTNIPQGFAEGLTNIEEVVLTNKTVNIQSTAFLECSNLKYLYLPRSIKSIGMFSFIRCPEIEVEYEGTVEEFKNIQLQLTSFHFDVIIKCSDKEIKFEDVWDN